MSTTQETIKLKVTGGASQRDIGHFQLSLPLARELSQTNLMDFLRDQGISIASSCYGEGICAKCKIQINKKVQLSCQVKLAELTDEETFITIDYL